MNNFTLNFLYSRLKKPELTKEQTKSKVCQEIFISKIGNNKDLTKKVAFKGGLIIDSLSQNKRGFTKDIDFDFVKYPLSLNGIQGFIDSLNSVNPYQNIFISIVSINELRHHNYRGKRVVLAFSDNIDVFNLTLDIGVFLPLYKKNYIYEYRVAFGETSNICVNPIERMIAEKLFTFAIYGTDNTRDKDLFDAYYLLTTFSCDKKLIKKMLNSMLVTKKHYFKNLELAFASVRQTLLNRDYIVYLKKSTKNWINEDVDIIVDNLNNYLYELLRV